MADARRVLGYGGAFPPYAALVEKLRRARDFAEAFSLRPRHCVISVQVLPRSL